MPDPDGGAILVDLDEGHRLRRCTVLARDLRDLWRQTHAATGHAAVGVKAHGAALPELAALGRTVTAEDLPARRSRRGPRRRSVREGPAGGGRGASVRPAQIVSSPLGAAVRRRSPASDHEIIYVNFR
jgi:hypothetical protein